MTSEGEFAPNTVISARHLVGGDAELEQKLIELSQDDDVPLLVFDWADENLTLFWEKAVAYGAVAGAHPPPDWINNGLPLQGQPIIMKLKQWILAYGSGNGGSIIGNTVGLFGHIQDIYLAVDFVGDLHNFLWFCGVMEQGSPLPGPLATLFTQHPSGRNGEFTPLPLQSPLW
jgi:hypothetical protein